MLQSLVRKMKRRILNPIIFEQDTTSPEEAYWIDNNGNQMITDSGDELIFNIKS